MSNKSLKSTIKIATGSAIALTLAASPIAAQADVNPFGMTALVSGYMVADAKSMESKCGGNMAPKSGEAKCGSDMAGKKSSEAKCGSDMGSKKSSEAKCGGDMGAKSKPIVEAKCGEAKCGGKK
jgi:uncharacterized low-complexity protein